MLRLPRADPRFLKQESKAGINEPPVPRDRLLKPRFRFPEVRRADILRALGIAHRLSEAVYLGDGRWGRWGESQSLVRDSAYRVMGYIAAYRAVGESIYRNRALAGLNNLLSMQTADGGFPDLNYSERGVHGTRDALLETAAAGLALLDGYALEHDSRLLDASARAAQAEQRLHVGETATSAAIASAHIAAHAQASSDDRLQSPAVDGMLSKVLPHQLPSGGWPGEDSWIWNHGLITWSLVRMIRALPLNHPQRPELMASLVAALNRMLREQTAQGDIPPNPRVKLAGYPTGHPLRAMLAAREITNAGIDSCLRGMMGHWLSKLPDEQTVQNHETLWRSFGTASTGPEVVAQTVWQADFGRFVRDAEWGEVAIGTVQCWPMGQKPDPVHQRWLKVTSERTGRNAQTITSRGKALVGGMGWAIPAGVLVAGRRYHFEVSVMCEGTTASLPFLVCSAVQGKRGHVWDCLSNATFTRESPGFDSYTTIATAFRASRDANRVYLWAAGEPIGADESVSVTVDEASVVDIGDPQWEWDKSLDSFDRDYSMFLPPAAAYAESLLHK